MTSEKSLGTSTVEITHETFQELGLELKKNLEIWVELDDFMMPIILSMQEKKD